MPSLPLADFADSLDEIMADIVRAFMRQKSDELFKGKITMPQFFLMLFLKKQGESRMTDIARVLSVTTAAATGVVERLVKGGYVTRVFDPHDRRIIRVRLSPKGSATVHKVIEQRRQMIISIFGKVSQDDREQYLAILRRVHQKVLQEYNGTGASHG